MIAYEGDGFSEVTAVRFSSFQGVTEWGTPGYERSREEQGGARPARHRKPLRRGGRE
jgi:hypothetical protein